MKVIFIKKQKEIQLDYSLLKKIAVYVADKFDSNKNAELNVIFVNSDEISQINSKYRNVAGPTDVLSFSYMGPMTDNRFKQLPVAGDMSDTYGFYVAGEIIICPEVAAANAGKNKKFISSGLTQKTDTVSEGRGSWDVLKEITLLIIHGILHLYDYDHENENDFKIMENIQNTILKDVLIKFFPEDI